jgi:hypothetical protein
MAASTGPHPPEGVASSKLSLSQRALARLPRLERERGNRPLGERLKSAMLKPGDPDTAKAKPAPEKLSVEQLEAQVKMVDDKERMIGLVAAPLAAAIGFLVIHTLVVNDPAAHLASGAANPRYVNPTVYDDLFLVLLALSMVMLFMALWRKRLYLGMVTALYGLAIFNLHYWGFGVPFVMVGAWYLVRAYRLNRSLKEAIAEGPSWGRPSENKRYTRPSATPKRLTSARPRRERSAG